MRRAEKLFRIAIEPRWLGALLSSRVAASAEHCDALKGLACACVVDIGANKGQFALLARRLFPSARIVAFEPLPRPTAVFRRVFAHDARVTLHACAVGERAGTASMHVSARDDSSSLLPITSLQSQIFPGTQESGTETIKVGRLEDFVSADEIKSPALLKLDVQGYELSALKGCENLLQHFAYVYAECSFVELYKGHALADEIIAWLRERGFILSGVYNLAYDRGGKAVQADFLFTRQSH